LLVAAVKGTDARATFLLKAPEPPVPAKTLVPARKETAVKKVVKRAAR